jgi:hypothetical protein
MVYADSTIDRYLADQDYKQLVKAGSLAVPLDTLTEDALPFLIAAEEWEAEANRLNDQTFVTYAKKNPDLVNALDTDDSKWLFTGVIMGVFVGAAATVVGNYVSEFLIDRHRKEKELGQTPE